MYAHLEGYVAGGALEAQVKTYKTAVKSHQQNGANEQWTKLCAIYSTSSDSHSFHVQLFDNLILYKPFNYLYDNTLFILVPIYIIMPFCSIILYMVVDGDCVVDVIDVSVQYTCIFPG